MIQLTRLNNQPLIVNSDLIKFVERAPDTVLTLTSSEKIVVLESVEQVLEKVIEFRRTVLSGLTVGAPETPAASPTGSAVAREKTEPE
jgi:flagellar protein FlbD